MVMKDRFPQAIAAIAAETDRLVLRMAHSLRNEMIQLVQRGSRKGRKYKRPGGRDHIASAPGEPPKTDTGALVRSIQVEHQPGSHTARVSVAARYAAELEFGTKKMAARPFMRPAIKNLKKRMPELAKMVRIKLEK